MKLTIKNQKKKNDAERPQHRNDRKNNLRAKGGEEPTWPDYN